MKPIDVEELAKKFDVESRYRKQVGKIGLFITWIAVAMSVFHLLTAGLFPMVTAKHRALHLAFALVLIFLMYPARKKSNPDQPTFFDYLFASLSAMGAGYLVVMFDSIALRGMSSTTLDLIMGCITMLMVLEAARRSIGKELPILAMLFLTYAYLGPYLPGSFAHRGYSLKTIIEQMYLGSEGIFGIALGVSATYIFLFILFGAFLNGTGMSAFFTNAAMGLAGHRPGGPAKVSILASGSLGMVNGSAVANVATTGVFSIPLMHSVGYSKRFASGVEAVASTGGQIMPPIMGTAAFIMAEFLGVPYTKIMIAALIPAILYYVALWLMVHYEAMKTGLKGLPKDQLPNVKQLLIQRGHLLLPLVLLLVMLFMGYTPVYAAFFSIVATYLISFARKETRMSLNGLYKALHEGAKGAVSLAAATAVVGFIVGVVALTGLGLQLANLILFASQGQLFITLVLAMVACIILGMGLPTAACYIVTATVAAPALTKLGIEPITAHLFVLYFASLSTITPPVALAAYAGAGISGANPSQVGWTAFRLGITGFIVPFMFVYSPSLLLQDDHYVQTAMSVVTALVGVFALGTSVVGYWRDHLKLWERILLFGAALLLIKGGLLTDLSGFAVLALVLVLQKKRISADMKEKPSKERTTYIEA